MSLGIAIPRTVLQLGPQYRQGECCGPYAPGLLVTRIWSSSVVSWRTGVPRRKLPDKARWVRIDLPDAEGSQVWGSYRPGVIGHVRLQW
jgi:hypothetical protein